MTRYLAISLALAAATIGLALASGAYRRPALVGGAASSFTAVASLLAMARFARARVGAKPVQAALGVMAIAFLARILLVALGTVLVVRSGESVVAFVLAFFVPYFAFTAVEGAYLHSLRGTGSTP